MSAMKLLAERVQSLVTSRHNIRNISVIAHVDHGKSTLSDSLLSKAGLINEARAGDVRALDTRKDEQLRAITIKSTGISLPFEMDDDDVKMANQIASTPPSEDVNEKKNWFLVNLIDSPGHVDFSSEVTAALRVTDGALVVVDCVEGVCVQTETVLRQGLMERVKPVLVINKIDRALQELKLTKEELYQRLVKVIDDVNQVISTYQDPAMGNLTVSPEKGTVAFSSGLQGWGFTLNQFAKRYAKKFGVDKDKLREKLWGENFFNPATKKWGTSSLEGATTTTPLERSFNMFVLEPIYQLFKMIMVDKVPMAQLCETLSKLNVTLDQEEREHLVEKKLLKVAMRKFLPAGDALAEMTVIHLPSPVTAQRYRVETLYEGPLDDEAAEGIRKCDPEGPLMIYISKMVPSDQGGRFTAFGRVFSGTVRSGQMVRIQGPRYEPGKKDDLFEKPVQRVMVMMGRNAESLGSCPAGCIVGLAGVDQYLLKSGTLSNLETAYNLKSMKFSVSAVVQVAVAPKNPSDLPKLIEGLKRLSKSDPLCQVTMSESGEQVLAAAGELHLEICLQDLEEEHAQIPIKVGDPIVPHRETVLQTSSMTCLSKSPNKHNRIYMTASPLDPEVIDAIETNKISSMQDPKQRGRILSDEYGWDVTLARKIWCFGPETTGANLLVDATKGVQYLNEIKDSCVAAFQWASKEGVLGEEPMRGCQFNIVDVALHSDKVHRGGGQIIPATRRAMFASFLTASPTLLEPVYLAEIQCPDTVVGGVRQVLSKRRGLLFSEEHRGDGNPLCTLKAYLPVRDSFGFTAALRSATGGQAFPQLIFDHWEVMSQEFLEAHQVIKEIRTRKGLNPEVPALDQFNDRL